MDEQHNGETEDQIAEHYYYIGESVAEGVLMTLAEDGFSKKTWMTCLKVFTRSTELHPVAVLAAIHFNSVALGGYMESALGGDVANKVFGTVAKVKDEAVAEDQVETSNRRVRLALDLILAEAKGEHDIVHVYLDSLSQSAHGGALIEELYGVYTLQLSIGHRMHSGKMFVKREDAGAILNDFGITMDFGDESDFDDLGEES